MNTVLVIRTREVKQEAAPWLSVLSGGVLVGLVALIFCEDDKSRNAIIKTMDRLLNVLEAQRTGPPPRE